MATLKEMLDAQPSSTSQGGSLRDLIGPDDSVATSTPGESGYFSGGLRSLYRGVADIGVQAGKAMEYNADYLGGIRDAAKLTLVNKAGRALANISQQVEDVVAPANYGDNDLKRSVFQGIESAPASIAYALPSYVGAGVGAALGLATVPETGPVGPIAGAVAGGAIAQAPSAAIMYRAQTQQAADELDALQKQGKLKEGVTNEQKLASAQKSGLYEAGGESASDIAESVLFSRLPFLKTVSKTVRGALAPGLKALGKTYLGVLASEQVGEGVTAYGQTDVKNELLKPEYQESKLGAVLYQAGPTTVMSALMFGAGAAKNKITTDQVISKVESEKTPQEERLKLAARIGAQLKESAGAAPAKNFLDHAADAIINPNTPNTLDLNDPTLLEPYGAPTKEAYPAENKFPEATPSEVSSTETAPAVEPVSETAPEEPSGKLFERLPDAPDALRFMVRGTEYAYLPKEGQTIQDLNTAVEGKSPAAAVNWLRKNAELRQEVAPEVPGKIVEAGIGNQAQLNHLETNGFTDPTVQTKMVIDDAITMHTNTIKALRDRGKNVEADALDARVRESAAKIKEAAAGDKVTVKLVDEALAAIPVRFDPQRPLPTRGKKLQPVEAQNTTDSETQPNLSLVGETQKEAPNAQTDSLVSPAVAPESPADTATVQATDLETQGSVQAPAVAPVVSKDGFTATVDAAGQRQPMVAGELNKGDVVRGEVNGVAGEYKVIAATGSGVHLKPTTGKSVKLDIFDQIRTEGIKRAPKIEIGYVSPATDTPMGVNAAGEKLYEDSDGFRYRIRTDRKNRPNGYPDFGGDLAPVSEELNIQPKSLFDVEGTSVKYDGQQPQVDAPPLHLFTVQTGAATGATIATKSLDKAAVTQAVADAQKKFAKSVATAKGTSTVETVSTELKDFLGRGHDKLTGSGKLRVVQSVAELPGGEAVDLRTKDSMIAGVYDPATGQVTLVADNIKAGDAKYVMLHEGGHALMNEDKVFKRQYARILDEFESRRPRDYRVQDAFKRVPDDTPAEKVREEALMYYVQEKKNHATGLWAKIKAAVRGWLARQGIHLKTLSNDDIVSMITQGVKRLGGTESGTSGARLFSKEQVVEAARAIYSKLEQVTKSSFQGMKAQGVVNFLTKQGVKKAEMEAVGLNEWLAAKKPTDKVTQAELVGFIKANTVELEDVVLGGENDTKASIAGEDGERIPITLGEDNGKWVWTTETGEDSGVFGDTITEAREAAEMAWGNPTWDLQMNEGGQATHFSKYTEPGAVEGSYREMFVTAPKLSTFETQDWAGRSELFMDGKFFARYLTKDEAGRSKEAMVNNPDNSSHTFEIKPAQGEAVLERKMWEDGHSQYSEVANPVVRIRFNEVNADGKRLLRIEEMQGPNPDNQAKMPKHLRENIYQLGVKRILAYAKENGFDGVALATKPGMTAGETQADRYSLEKQINAISYWDNPNAGGRSVDYEDTSGTAHRVGTIDKNGLIIRGAGAGKHISEFVGKEAAEKITADKGVKGRLEGIDLRVGGEGLKQLYDITLPAMLEAYGKGKMETTDFNALLTNGNTGEKVSMPYGSVPYLPLENAPASFPLFSVSKPDTIYAAADKVLKDGQERIKAAGRAMLDPKSKLHNFFIEHAPQWLAVTPLPTLVQTYGKTIPQIKAFSEHLNAIVAAKTDIVDTAFELRDEAVKLAEEGAGIATFNNTAAVASFNRMTPWEDIYTQDWVPTRGTKEERLKQAEQTWISSGMRKATKLTYRAAYAEARAAYDGLKTDALKDAYINVVKNIAEVRVRERNNLLAYIESMSEEGSDLRTSLMDQFNASFSNLSGAYWPLARVGDFILEYTDNTGTRQVKHFVNISERINAKLDAIEQGADPASIKEDFKDKQPKGAAAIPQVLMGQLAAAVEAKYLEGVNPGDPDAVSEARERAQATVNDMNQIWLRWQPETSALKNSIRRGNVKGFSEDMLRSYLDYMQRHASNIAWTEQGRKIEQDIQSLGDDIREQKNTGGEEGVDVTMKRHLLNDLRARIQALHDARVGVVASAAGKLSTGYYMTSPSIALVQMSQLAVLTLPKLSVMYGPAKAASALTKATGEAFSKRFTRDPMFKDQDVQLVYGNLRAVVTDENRTSPNARGKNLGDRLFSAEQILKQIESLSPYQQQLLALREAMARNLLDISAAHEAYELTQGKDPQSWFRKAFHYAMQPMSLSELASRKAAVLSTFELSQQNGKNFFEAMNDVSEVVNDTLYSYSKENKGRAMQGGLARVLLQFQHYRIMTGIRLAMLLRNSIKGESPEVRKAATKEFIGIMGMTGALAGTLGLPMASTMFALLNAALGDDDEPVDSQLIFTNWLEEQLGETGAGVVSKGLPTLAGADLSNRLGLNTIYGAQNEPPPGMHGRNLAAWWAANEIGPIFSVGQSWVQGYDEMVNKGHYLRGLEAATPKPIKDALKAYRVGTEGLKTSQGKRLLSDDEIGPDEVVMLALGFNADEVAAAQAKERSLTKLSTTISERRGRLISDAAQALIEGEGSEDAMEAIRTFNAKMPRFAITGRDVRPAMRKILKGDLGATGKREVGVADEFGVGVYRGEGS